MTQSIGPSCYGTCYIEVICTGAYSNYQSTSGFCSLKAILNSSYVASSPTSIGATVLESYRDSDVGNGLSISATNISGAAEFKVNLDRNNSNGLEYNCGYVITMKTTATSNTQKWRLLLAN
jgi:hypothetical protein